MDYFVYYSINEFVLPNLAFAVIDLNPSFSKGGTIPYKVIILSTIIAS